MQLNLSTALMILLTNAGVSLAMPNLGGGLLSGIADENTAADQSQQR